MMNTRMNWKFRSKIRDRFFCGFSLISRNFSIVTNTSVSFIVSGEVSGDTIGSRLMSSLKTLYPLPLRFAGVGGSLMSKDGLKSLFPMEDIAVMGIWELLPHLNKIRGRLKDATDAAVSFHPHVVVTVDSKGFSFHLLKQLQGKLHHSGLGKVVKQGLTEFVDHVLCILPFEEEVCRSNGLAATFVGHPILEDALGLTSGCDTPPNELKMRGDAEGFQRKYGLSSGATIISVLPGSRLQEVSRMLPIFSDTMELVKDSFPELTTTWPVSTILISGGSVQLKYDAFSASTAALNNLRHCRS
ncbi:hypothetical protein MKX01_020868 [Papaver californicum]|nr:hypothetical protein MKX01_020868 [Papaver californicum]